MPAGTYRSRLVLQQPSGAQDSIGQPIRSWTDITPLWADVRLANGLQAIKADADSSTVKASVRIRYRTGITAAMRLVQQGTGTVYNILATLPDARKRHLDLVCEVVT